MFDTLFIVTIVTFIVWYGQYLWKRRRLNALASKINGPPTLPFIGNGMYFLHSNQGILDNLMQLTHDYESPVRVWMGPELLIGVWKPNQVETILNNTHALNKAKAYGLIKMVVGDGLFTADAPTWKRHKKIILSTFNQHILNGFVEVFFEQSKILVEQLKIFAGEREFDVHHYVSKCSLDMFCETSMGITVNAQTTDCDYMRWVNRVMEIGGKLVWMFWCTNEFILKCTPIGKEALELINKIHNFTGNVVKERRLKYQKKVAENKAKSQSFYEEDINKRKPFVDQLLKLSEETGTNFTDVELREEVDTFMIAGTDTTATVVSSVLVVLAMFSEIQDTVYAEVLEVLGPDRPVEWMDLGKFVYLERVIKETLRVFPVAAIVGRLLSEDMELDNCIIPAGSTVLVHMLQLHRDPKTWPEPLKFDPDRFLPEKISRRHPYSYLPFLGGLRSCVGARYAMMTIKTVIATVIRTYKLSTTYKDVEDIKLQFDLVLKPLHGYKVSLELRSSA